MIDYELLKSLPIDEGMEYLRRMLAGGVGDLNPGTKMVDYYADNPNGVVGEGGRFEGSGVLSERLGILESADPTRSYVARFDPSGNFIDVGQQGADSWYDKPVGPMGLPLGALLPLAAAAAGAYFPGTEVAGLDAAGAPMIESLDGPASLLGDSGVEMISQGAANSGFGELGSGTFGMNSAWELPTLASANSSTLPALTASGSGLLGGSLPSVSAIGATAAGITLPEVLRTVRDLAPVIGAVAGAATSGDRQQTTSQAREPWAPAQDWLKGTIQDGQTLSDYYKRQPFNATQQSAYQNLFSDIGNYRDRIAPGIFDLANNLGKPYQVQLGTQQPGVRSTPVTGAPYEQTEGDRLAMLLNDGGRNPWAPTARGIFGMGATSPYGQIDWASMNPFSGLLGG